MKVFDWQDVMRGDFKLASFFSTHSASALAIGAFDGPHLGHQALFNAVLSQKKLLHGLVTFSRSPRAAKETQQFEGDVSTLRLRLERFESLGFDFVLVIDFSGNFSKIRGRDFLTILYKSLAMRFLTVGPFFRCGYKLDTGEEEIRCFAAETDITFAVVPEVADGAERISSTLIRQVTAAGDFTAAKKLLGFAYRLDVADIPYRRLQDGCLFAKNALTQIIPPVGQYTVCIETAGKSGSPACLQDGILIVEEENLRCLFCVPEAASLVRTINFGNPDEKRIEKRVLQGV